MNRDDSVAPDGAENGSGRFAPAAGDPAAAVSLAPLTTLGVGGPAEFLVRPTTERELVEQTLGVWSQSDDWFVLGGGSNVVVGDDGFAGTVIQVATRGISRIGGPIGTVRLRVQAGETWDDLVRYTVDSGWSGLEALSGIPGSVGAAPIQNIGAYGQEVGDALYSVDFLDFDSGRVKRLLAAELELGYRTSVFKRGQRGVVLSVTLDLDAADTVQTVASSNAELHLTPGRPIAYAQLAAALGVNIGDRVAISAVRTAVLSLRASKGMVLNDSDSDTRSAGSFFTNPIVSRAFAAGLPGDAPRWSMLPEADPIVLSLDQVNAGLVGVPQTLPAPADQGAPSVKLSAAWLIEHSGIGKGFRLPGSGAAISSKHTLAITNTGTATAADVAELARFVQNRVAAEFGVILVPEPVFIGHSL